jgi:hypothetical protein
LRLSSSGDFVFAQARELQANPNRPPLAMVEKPIAEIFFEVDIHVGRGEVINAGPAAPYNFTVKIGVDVLAKSLSVVVPIRC